jgi:hypothetical protein
MLGTVTAPCHKVSAPGVIPIPLGRAGAQGSGPGPGPGPGLSPALTSVGQGGVMG